MAKIVSGLNVRIPRHASIAVALWKMTFGLRWRLFRMKVSAAECAAFSRWYSSQLRIEAAEVAA